MVLRRHKLTESLRNTTYQMLEPFKQLYYEYKGLNADQAYNGILKQADSVRKALKRQDRVIWWMQWYRKMLLNNIRDSLKMTDDVADEYNNLNIAIENLNKKWLPDTNDHDIDNFTRWFINSASLNHWVNMIELSPDVDNIEWLPNLRPNQLTNRLYNAEQNWRKREKEDNGIVPLDTDTMIISFNNGTSGWWLLPRHTCPDEADAMGHCSTGPANSKILSFRTKTKSGNWYPHLTFILEKDGKLGEMKGRGNDKPIKKYHPYIIPLLLNNIVEGIKGGGYMPENNFMLEDLGEEKMIELIKKKPVLGTLKQRIELFGVTKDVLKEVENELNSLDSRHQSFDIASQPVSDLSETVLLKTDADEYIHKNRYYNPVKELDVFFLDHRQYTDILYEKFPEVEIYAEHFNSIINKSTEMQERFREVIGQPYHDFFIDDHYKELEKFPEVYKIIKNTALYVHSLFQEHIKKNKTQMETFITNSNVAMFDGEIIFDDEISKEGTTIVLKPLLEYLIDILDANDEIESDSIDWYHKILIHDHGIFGISSDTIYDLGTKIDLENLFVIEDLTLKAQDFIKKQLIDLFSMGPDPRQTEFKFESLYRKKL